MRLYIRETLHDPTPSTPLVSSKILRDVDLTPFYLIARFPI